MERSTPTGYRVTIAHRRRSDVESERFREDWDGPYADLVARLRPNLAFDAHSSLRVVDSRRRAPSSEPPDNGQEVDVVEHFNFDSEDGYRSALESEAARAAFRELARFRASRVARTGVVVGPVHSVVPFGGEAPFARVLLLLRAAKDKSRDEMQRYWLESHGPLVRSMKRDLAMEGYEQHHAAAEPELGPAALALEGADVFEGTASLIYPSMQALLGVFRSEAGRAADRRLLEDEVRFVDSTECIVVMGEER